MQTKLQIEQLLSSSGVRPNKRFGQHFLIDLNLMRLLLDTAQLTKNDVVLEVGCGTGSMTEGIAEKAGYCVAVEIDAVLANIAREQLADYQNVEIIAADALKNKFEINPVVLDALNRARATHTGRLLLIANLPYAAGTPLMLDLITGTLVADSTGSTPSTSSGQASSPDNDVRGQAGQASSPQVDAMFVTVQKEVANRMAAQQGTKDYGILSILLSATGDLKHIRTLKPTVFWPQPQVNSAMISYVRNAEKIKQVKSIETLGAVAGGLLQHRRKMLKSCCKLLTGNLGKIETWPEIFAKCSIDPSSRPDQLTVKQYVGLANLCSDRE